MCVEKCPLMDEESRDLCCECPDWLFDECPAYDSSKCSLPFCPHKQPMILIRELGEF